jgi:NAD(P)-dependent dehydrogenase (short-subunit alcohol dehydrogenase family)
MEPDTERVAIVTGASRGIGAAIAKALAQERIHVIGCGRDRAALQATVSAITSAGGHAEAAECDVTILEQVQALASRIEKSFGRIDVLVNNAGVGSFRAPLHKLAPDEWDRVMNTNLRGVYYCIRSFAELMIRSGGGHIINISSLAGKNPLPNGAAYAASKWGLNGLSYSVAEELREQNIRVSVICPGSVDTDLSPHTGKDVNKMLSPEDIAHVAQMIVTQSPQSFASEILLRPAQKP